MSKKSKPGDGTHGQGQKGGAISFAPDVPSRSFVIILIIQALRNIRRMNRAS